MIKELEKIMIEDVEYAYDPEKEYIKDGHAYCKVCHEQKDGKPIPMLNKPMIFKMACKCDRDCSIVKYMDIVFKYIFMERQNYCCLSM